MSVDDKLRESFASLSRTEAVRAPSFDAVLGRTRRPSVHRLRGIAAVAAVMAVVAVSVFQGSHHRGSPALGTAEPMLADWRAPTDFLLETPGRVLLHTIPKVGHYPSDVLDSFPPTRFTTPVPRAGREHS